MNKNYLIHSNDTLYSPRVKSFLSDYTDPHKLKTYAVFWIVQEILAQNKNSLSETDLAKKVTDYIQNIMQDNTLVAGSEDIIRVMRIHGLLKEESGMLFSGFQKVVNESRSKKRQEAGIIKQENDTNKKLIKRLEDKITFMKNGKPKLKRKVNS